MGTFTEYRPPLPLPAVGDGFEHTTLDLKREVKTAEHAEIAKDLAAFANHLGGTILIGATEGSSGCVGTYHPLTDKDLKKTQDAISMAAKRCFPKPVFDFGHYEQNGGYILTVLVWPYIGQPIGVKVSSDKTKGGYGGDSYFFPVRSGSHTVFLSPEQLPMYMLPEMRKLVITLGQATHHSPVMLHTFDKVARAAIQTSFVSTDLLNNTLTVLMAPHDANIKRPPSDTNIPLDAISAAWKTSEGVHVLLSGMFGKKGEFIWRQRTS